MFLNERVGWPSPPISILVLDGQSLAWMNLGQIAAGALSRSAIPTCRTGRRRVESAPTPRGTFQLRGVSATAAHWKSSPSLAVFEARGEGVPRPQERFNLLSLCRVVDAGLGRRRSAGAVFLGAHQQVRVVQPR